MLNGVWYVLRRISRNIGHIGLLFSESIKNFCVLLFLIMHAEKEADLKKTHEVGSLSVQGVFICLLMGQESKGD